MAIESGRHRGHASLRLWLIICTLVLVAAGSALLYTYGPRFSLVTFSVAVAIFGWTMSSLELKWRMYTRRSPEAREDMAFPPAVTAKVANLSFDLLVPAKNEARVIYGTLLGLCASAYSAYKVFPTLRAGDTDTIHAAERARDHHADHIELVVRQYDDDTEAKPAQLNTALVAGNGDIIGIVDAEDTVHPELLGHVAAMFAQDKELMIVQAGVQLVNLDLRAPVGASLLKRLLYRLRGWFCVHNVLEYWFWFSSRMFYQIAQKVVPLGGNTVFIRRSAFDELGGWEGLTEDCDLGIRASRLGMKIAAAYDPRLATREETPASLLGFFFQRRRWGQGFLEVLEKGDWRKLPTFKQRVIALYILGMPFLQAFYGLLLPVSVVASFLLVAPVGLVLLMFIPIILLILTLLLQILGLRQFGRDFGQKVTPWHYAVLVIGFYPFQLVLAVAAIDATRRWLKGERAWDLTEHNGLHRIDDIMELDTEGGAA
jgi:cellulose synthase/poly-beta-1,6-N-acetylglucosamine synthase-like glycosyltransferase